MIYKDLSLPLKYKWYQQNLHLTHATDQTVKVLLFRLFFIQKAVNKSMLTSDREFVLF